MGAPNAARLLIALSLWSGGATAAGWSAAGLGQPGASAPKGSQLATGQQLSQEPAGPAGGRPQGAPAAPPQAKPPGPTGFAAPLWRDSLRLAELLDAAQPWLARAAGRPGLRTHLGLSSGTAAGDLERAMIDIEAALEALPARLLPPLQRYEREAALSRASAWRLYCTLRPWARDPRFWLERAQMALLDLKPGTPDHEQASALLRRALELPGFLAGAQIALREVPAPLAAPTALAFEDLAQRLTRELPQRLLAVEGSPAIRTSIRPTLQAAAEALDRMAQWLHEDCPPAGGPRRIDANRYSAWLQAETLTKLDLNGVEARLEAELSRRLVALPPSASRAGQSAEKPATSENSPESDALAQSSEDGPQEKNPAADPNTNPENNAALSAATSAAQAAAPDPFLTPDLSAAANLLREICSQLPITLAVLGFDSWPSPELGNTHSAPPRPLGPAVQFSWNQAGLSPTLFPAAPDWEPARQAHHNGEFTRDALAASLLLECFPGGWTLAAVAARASEPASRRYPDPVARRALSWLFVQWMRELELFSAEASLGPGTLAHLDQRFALELLTLRTSIRYHVHAIESERLVEELALLAGMPRSAALDLLLEVELDPSAGMSALAALEWMDLWSNLRQKAEVPSLERTRLRELLEMYPNLRANQARAWLQAPTGPGR
jgi:hypothetical protein